MGFYSFFPLAAADFVFLASLALLILAMILANFFWTTSVLLPGFDALFDKGLAVCFLAEGAGVTTFWTFVDTSPVFIFTVLYFLKVYFSPLIALSPKILRSASVWRLAASTFFFKFFLRESSTAGFAISDLVRFRN